MSNDVTDNRSTMLVIAMFVAVFLLIGWDLYVDYDEGVSFWHFSVELIVLAVAFAGIVVMWRQLDRTRSKLMDARVEVAQWQKESAELLAGLGVAIERQFERWGLSVAEKDVALLLLKGLSHKEIAAARDTSERTVREQGRAVYRKSGLGGRSALSAFFLEDLLLPHRETAGTEETAPGLSGKSSAS